MLTSNCSHFSLMPEINDNLLKKEKKRAWTSSPPSPALDSELTRTCQTFSSTPSKLQKRMLTPTRPWPPQVVLGVMKVSLTVRVLLLYSRRATGRSTLALSRSFSVSLSWFWQVRRLQCDQEGRMAAGGRRQARVALVHLPVWCHQRRRWSQRTAPVQHGDQGSFPEPLDGVHKTQEDKMFDELRGHGEVTHRKKQQVTATRLTIQQWLGMCGENCARRSEERGRLSFICTRMIIHNRVVGN